MEDVPPAGEAGGADVPPMPDIADGAAADNTATALPVTGRSLRHARRESSGVVASAAARGGKRGGRGGPRGPRKDGYEAPGSPAELKRLAQDNSDWFCTLCGQLAAPKGVLALPSTSAASAGAAAAGSEDDVDASMSAAGGAAATAAAPALPSDAGVGTTGTVGGGGGEEEEEGEAGCPDVLLSCEGGCLRSYHSQCLAGALWRASLDAAEDAAEAAAGAATCSSGSSSSAAGGAAARAQTHGDGDDATGSSKAPAPSSAGVDAATAAALRAAAVTRIRSVIAAPEAWCCDDCRQGRFPCFVCGGEDVDDDARVANQRTAASGASDVSSVTAVAGGGAASGSAAGAIGAGHRSKHYEPILQWGRPDTISDVGFLERRIGDLWRNAEEERRRRRAAEAAAAAAADSATAVAASAASGAAAAPTPDVAVSGSHHVSSGGYHDEDDAVDPATGDAGASSGAWIDGVDRAIDRLRVFLRIVRAMRIAGEDTAAAAAAMAVAEQQDAAASIEHALRSGGAAALQLLEQQQQQQAAAAAVVKVVVEQPRAASGGDADADGGDDVAMSRSSADDSAAALAPRERSQRRRSVPAAFIDGGFVLEEDAGTGVTTRRASSTGASAAAKPSVASANAARPKTLAVTAIRPPFSVSQRAAVATMLSAVASGQPAVAGAGTAASAAAASPRRKLDQSLLPGFPSPGLYAATLELHDAQLADAAAGARAQHSDPTGSDCSAGGAMSSSRSSASSVAGSTRASIGERALAATIASAAQTAVSGLQDAHAARGAPLVYSGADGLEPAAALATRDPLRGFGTLQPPPSHGSALAAQRETVKTLERNLFGRGAGSAAATAAGGSSGATAPGTPPRVPRSAADADADGSSANQLAVADDQQLLPWLRPPTVAALDAAATIIPAPASAFAADEAGDADAPTSDESAGTTAANSDDEDDDAGGQSAPAAPPVADPADTGRRPRRSLSRAASAASAEPKRGRSTSRPAAASAAASRTTAGTVAGISLPPLPQAPAPYEYVPIAGAPEQEVGADWTGLRHCAQTRCSKRYHHACLRHLADIAVADAEIRRHRAAVFEHAAYTLAREKARKDIILQLWKARVAAEAAAAKAQANAGADEAAEVEEVEVVAALKPARGASASRGGRPQQKKVSAPTTVAAPADADAGGAATPLDEAPAPAAVAAAATAAPAIDAVVPEPSGDLQMPSLVAAPSVPSGDHAMVVTLPVQDASNAVDADVAASISAVPVASTAATGSDAVVPPSGAGAAGEPAGAAAAPQPAKRKAPTKKVPAAAPAAGKKAPSTGKASAVDPNKLPDVIPADILAQAEALLPPAAAPLLPPPVFVQAKDVAAKGLFDRWLRDVDALMRYVETSQAANDAYMRFLAQTARASAAGALGQELQPAAADAQWSLRATPGAMLQVYRSYLRPAQQAPTIMVVGNASGLSNPFQFAAAAAPERKDAGLQSAVDAQLRVLDSRVALARAAVLAGMRAAALPPHQRRFTARIGVAVAAALSSVGLKAEAPPAAAQLFTSVLTGPTSSRPSQGIRPLRPAADGLCGLEAFWLCPGASRDFICPRHTCGTCESHEGSIVATLYHDPISLMYLHGDSDRLRTARMFARLPTGTIATCWTGRDTTQLRQMLLWAGSDARACFSELVAAAAPHGASSARPLPITLVQSGGVAAAAAVAPSATTVAQLAQLKDRVATAVDAVVSARRAAVAAATASAGAVPSAASPPAHAGIAASAADAAASLSQSASGVVSVATSRDADTDEPVQPPAAKRQRLDEGGAAATAAGDDGGGGGDEGADVGGDEGANGDGSESGDDEEACAALGDFASSRRHAAAKARKASLGGALSKLRPQGASGSVSGVKRKRSVLESLAAASRQAEDGEALFAAGSLALSAVAVPSAHALVRSALAGFSAGSSQVVEGAKQLLAAADSMLASHAIALAAAATSAGATPASAASRAASKAAVLSACKLSELQSVAELLRAALSAASPAALAPVPLQPTSGRAGGGVLIDPAFASGFVQLAKTLQQARTTSSTRLLVVDNAQMGIYRKLTSRHFAKSCLYCCKAFHDRCVPPGTVANPFACLCPQHAYRQLPGETEDDVDKHLRSLGIDKAALLAGGGDDDHDDHHHLALALAADAGPSIVLSKMPPAKLAAAAKNILRKLRAPSIACLPPAITAAYDERHYRLPYALAADKLSKPPSWTVIKKNVYVSKVRPEWPDSDVCTCAGICGDDCVNRLLRVECCGDASMTEGSGRANCAVGPGCGNRALQVRDMPHLELVPTPGKGWGVIAGHDIPAGTFVIEYVGEIIDEEEQSRRLEEYKQRGEAHYYMMEIDANQIIDARWKSNYARFINHSCAPNCELQRWQVDGYTRIGIFAVEDVLKGEEICYDYQFFTAETAACHCGAETCRGLLGANLAKERDAKLAAEAAAKAAAAAAKKKGTAKGGKK